MRGSSRAPVNRRGASGGYRGRPRFPLRPLLTQSPRRYSLLPRIFLPSKYGPGSDAAPPYSNCVLEFVNAVGSARGPGPRPFAHAR